MSKNTITAWNSKTELTWLIASLLVSIGILAYLTDFRMANVEIRFYGETYVSNPMSVVQNLTFGIISFRIIYMAVMLCTQHRLAALLISIINPLVAVLWVIGLFYAIEELSTFRKSFPAEPFPDRLAVIVLLGCIISFHILIEIRALRTLKSVFNDRPLTS